MYKTPKLYTVSSTGVKRFWQGFSEQGEYWSHYGNLDGKTTISERVEGIPKNVGKSNETTPEIRAANKRDNTPYPVKTVVRRLGRSEVEVAAMFVQGFSSTACGHGGIGGSALTDAYVICLMSSFVNEGLVYSAGRLLKKYDLTNHDMRDKFYKILNDRRIIEG